MKLTVSQAIADALKTLHDVPDNLQARFDAMAKGPGGYTLTLGEDDATALAELVQWHVRTDPATGKPTKETAPFAELVRLIDEASF